MKPFNIEQAAAGAPVRLSDGTENVRIVCTDRIGPAPVVALVTGVGNEYLREYTADGAGWNQPPSPAWPGSQPTALARLVMAPIGTLDGRDVYWGDTLCDPSGAEVTVTWPFPAGMSWPRVYPKCGMNAYELAQAANGVVGQPVPPITGREMERALRIANTAEEAEHIRLLLEREREELEAVRRKYESLLLEACNA